MNAKPHIPPFRYALYATLVGIKRALHLSRTAHRNFFVLKLVRALEAGQIGAECHITAAGKRDGVGAQVHARMSAMCLAHAYGLRYVHSPFVSLAHAEVPMPQWVAAWEERFNLGEGELRADQVDLPHVDIETFVMNRKLWTRPCVVTTRHYHAFCKLQPDAYGGIIPRLRDKYHQKQGQRRHAPVTEVCVHVRRGDVTVADAETAHRLTENQTVLSTIRLVREHPSVRDRPHRIRIFSQGVADDFRCFAEQGCELCLNLPAMETFQELVAANVLVMARSSFSFVAALLGEGVKLYDPFGQTPLSEWIAIDHATGGFDADRFRMALERSGR